jgi:hypothetical protein
MRPALLLVASHIAIAALLTQAQARLQPDVVCIDPDMEFPVACDDDED